MGLSRLRGLPDGHARTHAAPAAAARDAATAATTRTAIGVMCGRRPQADQPAMPHWVNEMSIVLSSISCAASLLLVTATLLGRRRLRNKRPDQMFILRILTWVGISDLILSFAWCLPELTLAWAPKDQCIVNNQVYNLGVNSTGVWTIAFAYFLKNALLQTSERDTTSSRAAMRLPLVHLAAWGIPALMFVPIYFECTEQQAHESEHRSNSSSTEDDTSVGMSASMSAASAFFYLSLLLGMPRHGVPHAPPRFTPSLRLTPHALGGCAQCPPSRLAIRYARIFASTLVWRARFLRRAPAKTAAWLLGSPRSACERS